MRDSDDDEEEEQEGAGVADIEADVEQQRKGRLQALAFALDKAKLILRHQARLGSKRMRGAGTLPPAAVRVPGCCMG